jgi:hypothetical protein
MTNIKIRNYTSSDLAAIQRIHEANGIDYRLPNLVEFPVNKVLEVDGEVRASLGLQRAYEAHLWLDPSNWTDAAGKWAAIKVLDQEATRGVSGVLCCVPPGYERFGRRIKDLGFAPLRDGWTIYCKAGDGK